MSHFHIVCGWFHDYQVHHGEKCQGLSRTVTWQYSQRLDSVSSMTHHHCHASRTWKISFLKSGNVEEENHVKVVHQTPTLRVHLTPSPILVACSLVRSISVGLSADQILPSKISIKPSLLILKTGLNLWCEHNKPECSCQSATMLRNLMKNRWDRGPGIRGMLTRKPKFLHFFAMPSGRCESKK